MRTLPLSFLVGLLLSGCSDDATSTSTGAGGQGTGGGSTTATTVGSGGATTGSGGDGGAGGGGPSCAPITLVQVPLATCDAVGPLALADSGVTECTPDGTYNPAVIYRVPVSAGDCLHMQGDNVGSTTATRLFGGIIDPNGHSLELNTGTPCTVAVPGGQCPAGGATIEMTGDAYVVIGATSIGACIGTTPYQLAVSLNGTDVALTPLCSGDLNTIFQ